MFGWLSFLSIFPLFLLLSIPISVYGYLVYINSYWKRHGVPFVKAKPLVGSFWEVCLFRRNVAENFNDLYIEAPDEPILGIHLFHTPALIIRDLDLIKEMLVKDFSSFQNRFA